MKILEPKVEYSSEVSQSKEYHFGECARICYASSSTNDHKLYEKLWEAGHKSMYRHISHYYKIPSVDISQEHLTFINANPFCDIVYNQEDGHFYMSTNEQFIREHPGIAATISDFEVRLIEAHNDSVFMRCGVLRYTFIITTGIDITRELNRKSPNNISEQSTRYVDFVKKIGIMFKKSHWMNNLDWYRDTLTKFMCKVDEWFYKISRSKYGLNLKPEDARWCLFLDTQSKVAYTYTFSEWKKIINLRYFGTTGKPHPDAKVIAKYIYEWFNLLGYHKWEH